MSTLTVGILALIVMLVLMMLRVPIALSMALPAIAGILYLKNWSVLETVVGSVFWTHSLSYTLSTIPMFLWMGEMLTSSGISSELYKACRLWFGKFKGGLSIATIGASAIFAAASGSSVANTGTIGMMASKEMLDQKYSKVLSSGSIVAGGTLGILIPPSGFLIIYGMMTEQSIGKLLLAGVIPGIILALLFVITIIISVRLKPDMAPAGESYSFKERFLSLKSTFWVILLFVVVIGGMFIGLFGPTEAAGIGAFVSTILAWAKGSLNWNVIKQTLIRTATTSGFLFAIILCAFLFNYLLTISKVPTAFSQALASAGLSPHVTFICIAIMFLILGALMDSMAVLVVTVPFVIPLINDMGHDLIWFGIVMCMLVEISLISPPHGMNIMVLNGVVPEYGIGKIYMGALLFMIPIVFMIILLYFFPEIALFLPERMIQ